ncbi:MAG: cytochrome c biogenesis protein CcsA [Pyrinomonadaceae bacterium]
MSSATIARHRNQPRNIEAPKKHTTLNQLLPLITAAVGAGLITILRYEGIALKLTNDWAMTVFALIGYISASVLMGTYLFTRDRKIARAGVWVFVAALICNVSAWTGRYIRFQYYPLNDLYDVALWFSMLGGAVSLFVSERLGHRYLLAIIAPVIVLALTTALLMGGEAPNLPPALRSYWRPLHVSFAVTSYAFCGVAFCVGLLHLLKERVSLASMGIFAAACGTIIYSVVSYGTILLDGTYALGVQIRTPEGVRTLEPIGEHIQGRSPEFLRAIVPGVGGMMRLALITLLAAFVVFLIAYFKDDDRWRRIGHYIMRGSLVAQAIGLVWLFAGARALTNVAEHIPVWQMNKVPMENVRMVSSQLVVSPQANPIELSGLITAAMMTLFIVAMSFKTERILAILPSSERLDDLTYRLASIAFPLLTLLLITGAVWANESWGRYWSWDPKENAALLTWLIYGIYLHVRIMRGWQGKRSAYFAVIGFAAVVFAFIGISFLPLNSLHAYIQ